MPLPVVPSPTQPPTNYPFYFAWVPPHTDFNASTMLRQDELIFSFDITHSEGAAATLTLVVQNPHIGLLNPARNQWAWFSWQDIYGTVGVGNGVYPLFYGRLVSVPTDMLSEAVTLQLVAMPSDLLRQKQTIAQAKQVRPYWDPVFVDAASRLDPDNVLEGYPEFWHIDRGGQGLSTLPVTTSDVLVGEDGLVEFLLSPDSAFYDSLKITIDKPPLQSVYVDAVVNWNQQATNYIDMGIQNPGTTLTPESLLQSWPKSFTNLGGGWQVYFSQAYDLDRTQDVQIVTSTAHYKNRETHHQLGDTMSVDISYGRPGTPGANNDQGLVFGITPLTTGKIISVVDIPAIVSGQPDFPDQPTAKVSVTSLFVIWNNGGLGLRLILQYNANRARTENVRFTLGADLQPVFTDPGGIAANFAQDSELLSLAGNVGNEGPYGTYRGTWGPGVFYALYDYFTVDIVPPGLSQAFRYAFAVTRNMTSLPTFDPNSTASLWQPLTLYQQGVSVYVGGFYYTVMVSHESGIGFNASAVDFDGSLIYQFQLNPDTGMPTYQLIPHFTGPFQGAYPYVAGDILIAPNGNYYNVIVGHDSAATFDQYAVDVTGRMLYGLLLNPPPIGNLASAFYFPSDRGAWSIEYLISRARAQLLDRSRSVKVQFDVPFMASGIQLSCRHNASVSDPRLPGGLATGKIVSYTMKGDGENAPVTSVTIACAVGNGNTVVGATGVPTYVDVGYVEAGYQYYSGNQVVMTDVGYSQPQYDASVDDGLNLLVPLTKADVVVENIFINNNLNALAALDSFSQGGTPVDMSSSVSGFPVTSSSGQFSSIQQGAAQAFGPEDTAIENATQAAYDATLKVSSYYILVLKPVANGPFSAEYDVGTSPLMVPQQINLAAPSTP